MCSFLQVGLGLFHSMHGVLGDHHQQIHKDYPGVQAQTEEHGEEPEDQAAAPGAGLPRADVGHVYQLSAQHSRRAAGAVQSEP